MIHYQLGKITHELQKAFDETLDSELEQHFVSLILIWLA